LFDPQIAQITQIDSLVDVKSLFKRRANSQSEKKSVKSVDERCKGFVMANIRTERLLKRFGDVAAVDHVDLEIREGSFTAILGPSGCGKTTLLRCIAGLVEADAGRVLIGGNDVTHVPPHKRNLGFVFQRPAMFPHMSVYDNIIWALQLRKWPKNKMRERVYEMLRLVRLEGLENRAYRQLSGGQAQRVVIARALAPQPDVLFLDEPLSQLDAKLRDELKLEIAEIHRQTGCTTLMVTHDQAEALTLADNVLLMNQGQIVQEGSPLELYRQPRTLFSADFIGTNNFMAGTITETGQCTTVALDGAGAVVRTEQQLAGAGTGAPVWVCIRADDIDVIDEDQRSRYPNVVSATIDKALLTGGTVIIQARVGATELRLHAGGSRRFQLLGREGTEILCSLGNISLIPRTADETPPGPR
jgi:ABC-type Fe3+/spermidine/putrescine transport system ATPase subunit